MRFRPSDLKAMTMNKDDLHAIDAALETLDSLSHLFRNLWFERIREDIEDEKVKAYLMVFDDAFPGINHVIGFVRDYAQDLASGDGQKLRQGFERLGQDLLDRESASSGFSDRSADEAEDEDVEGTLDALFESGEAATGLETEHEHDELEDLLAAEGEEEGEGDEIEDSGIGSLEEAAEPSDDLASDEEDSDLADLLDEGEETEALFPEEEEDLADEDGGAALMQDEEGSVDEAEVVVAEAQEELEGDDVEEEEASDLEDLLEAEDGDDDTEDGIAPGISTDEMGALLGTAEEEASPPSAPARKRGESKKGTPKRASADKASPESAPRKPRPASKRKATSAKGGGNGQSGPSDPEESISEDEIDALFG